VSRNGWNDDYADYADAIIKDLAPPASVDLERRLRALHLDDRSAALPWLTNNGNGNL
jgi:hypothetical protein